MTKKEKQKFWTDCYLERLKNPMPDTITSNNHFRAWECMDFANTSLKHLDEAFNESNEKARK